VLAEDRDEVVDDVCDGVGRREAVPDGTVEVDDAVGVAERDREVDDGEGVGRADVVVAAPPEPPLPAPPAPVVASLAGRTE
jgi:hypothetical protein